VASEIKTALKHKKNVEQILERVEVPYIIFFMFFLSKMEYVVFYLNIVGPPTKAKYYLITDSKKYCEGTLKRTRWD